MRFTVRNVHPGLFQVIDTARIDPDTRQGTVVACWQTYAAAWADARFRNEHPLR